MTKTMTRDELRVQLDACRTDSLRLSAIRKEAFDRMIGYGIFSPGYQELADAWDAARIADNAAWEKTNAAYDALLDDIASRALEKINAS